VIARAVAHSAAAVRVRMFMVFSPRMDERLAYRINPLHQSGIAAAPALTVHSGLPMLNL
jgi:hypothetical protein